eukprot:Rhum_TRINITY_DN14390_c13_g2::Rhum_TRINITY_DN14390_c13_g2_i1::g.85755::m.85755
MLPTLHRFATTWYDVADTSLFNAKPDVEITYPMPHVTATASHPSRGSPGTTSANTSNSPLAYDRAVKASRPMALLYRAMVYLFISLISGSLCVLCFSITDHAVMHAVFSKQYPSAGQKLSKVAIACPYRHMPARISSSAASIHRVTVTPRTAYSVAVVSSVPALRTTTTNDTDACTNASADVRMPAPLVANTTAHDAACRTVSCRRGTWLRASVSRSSSVPNICAATSAVGADRPDEGERRYSTASLLPAVMPTALTAYLPTSAASTPADTRGIFRSGYTRGDALGSSLLFSSVLAAQGQGQGLSQGTPDDAHKATYATLTPSQ